MFPQIVRMTNLRNLCRFGRVADRAGIGLFALRGFSRLGRDFAFVPYMLGIAVFVRIVGHSAALCGAFVPVMRLIPGPFGGPGVFGFGKAEPIDVCNIGLAGVVFEVEIDIVHALGGFCQITAEFHIIAPVVSSFRARQRCNLLAVQTVQTDMDLTTA